MQGPDTHHRTVWEAENRIRELERQLDALRRDLEEAKAKIKETEVRITTANSFVRGMMWALALFGALATQFPKIIELLKK